MFVLVVKTQIMGAPQFNFRKKPQATIALNHGIKPAFFDCFFDLKFPRKEAFQVLNLDPFYQNHF